MQRSGHGGCLRLLQAPDSILSTERTRILTIKGPGSLRGTETAAYHSASSFSYLRRRAGAPYRMRSPAAGRRVRSHDAKPERTASAVFSLNTNTATRSSRLSSDLPICCLSGYRHLHGTGFRILNGRERKRASHTTQQYSNVRQASSERGRQRKNSPVSLQHQRKQQTGSGMIRISGLLFVML